MILICMAAFISAELADYTFLRDTWPEKDSLFRGALVVQSDDMDFRGRRPIQLYVALDISQEFTARVKNAVIKHLQSLADELTPEDMLSLSVYSEYGRTLMPLRKKGDDSLDLSPLLAGLNAESGRSFRRLYRLLTDEMTRDNVVGSSEMPGQGERYHPVLLLLTLGTPHSDSVAASALPGKIRREVAVYSAGYGDKIDADYLISLSEETGGRAFYIPRDSTEFFDTAFQKLQADLFAPTVYDLSFRFSPPVHLENHVAKPNLTQEKYFINTLPEGGKKYIFFHVAGDSMVNRDIDVDYSFRFFDDVNRNTRFSFEIPDRSSGFGYNSSAAPQIILNSVLRHFLSYEDALLESDTEYRRAFATKFRSTVLGDLESVLRRLDNDEMKNVYSVLDEYSNTLYSSSVREDVALLLKRMKYKLHNCKSEN
ncbi:MAG: hypothetical protein ACQEQV_02920 [Fibrobacterota bacterium]